MVEEIQKMETILVDYIHNKIVEGNLIDINTCELGEAIDMIKDLAEAAYYCSMTK